MASRRDDKRQLSIRFLSHSLFLSFSLSFSLSLSLASCKMKTTAAKIESKNVLSVTFLPPRYGRQFQLNNVELINVNFTVDPFQHTESVPPVTFPPP